MNPLRVLLAEDSATDAKLVVLELRKSQRPIEFERVESPEALREALARARWDVVISDWSMPSFGALAALDILRKTKLDIPFIIVSGTIGEALAVQAMRAGASDYVLKDSLARLAPAVEREVRECEERRAHRRADEAQRGLEEQLRQAQKMEAVGRLAGGVAHDFNNLLSVILSCSEMLLDGLPAGHPMELELSEIRDAGLRAAELTRQLLTFSRQQVMRPTVLDLNEVMETMHKMLLRIVGADVKLRCLPSSVPSPVLADRGSVEQVLMNLVVNARDAMPSGGTLTMSTRNVFLDDEYVDGHLGAKRGPHVVLTVTDDGIGMDDTTKAHVFEPFFTTKDATKGTGLGLSTVFGIVQQSGGSICVESEVGRGTRFDVLFPRVDEEVTAERKTAEATPRLVGTETILLVEDDDRVRAVARDGLRKRGYTILEARNGLDALRVMETHAAAVKLVLTDVIMPEMSGTELAERLLEAHPAIKIICMSGYAGDRVRQDIGASKLPFVNKPFTPELLARTVRQVLDDPDG